MRTERKIERRAVSWDPDTRELVVGRRRVLLECDPGDNECVLRTYLSLVAEQRDIVLGLAMQIRADDIAVLAEILDLEDTALELRLQRLLRLSRADAATLKSRLLRHRLAAGAVGVGLLAAASVAAASVAAADPPPPHYTSSTDSGVDIGYTVRYERDPNYVAPEGVDIGDAMIIER